MSGHNYATLVKSGLQTQSSLVRELKVSKEELPRRYLTVIMENLHTNKDWYVLTYSHSAMREISDLVFFFKALHGWTDLDINTFVSFSNNGRTRLCQNPLLTLKVPLRKSNTFKASYLNRIIKKWNYICKVQHPSTFCSLSTFKRNIRNTYKNLLGAVFDIEMPCTWSLVCDCPCQ